MKKTLTEKEKYEYEYIIKSISSCINNTSPPLPYDNINWENILLISQKCCLRAMIADSVLRLSKFTDVPVEITEQLNEIKNKEIFIDGVRSFEIEKVINAFEKNKIKNIPLKGYFLKNEYPRTDFRSLSDYDILFDENDLDNVKNTLNKLGYTFISQMDNQFHFEKKPYMYIEMHATLVHSNELYFPYVKDFINQGISRENYRYSQNLRNEDFYLYMLIHHSNHFRIGGMGIRMVLDIYLFYRNHKDSFDFEYLANKLKICKLEVFEQKLREISFKWFSGKTPQIEFDKIETYILLSNTLGRINVGVMINAEKSIKAAKINGKSKSKFSYLVSSVFPSISIMKEKYEYLKKVPLLLPVSWVEMWFGRLFVLKNVHFKRGIKNRISYTDADVKYFKALLNNVGFNDMD